MLRALCLAWMRSAQLLPRSGCAASTGWLCDIPAPATVWWAHKPCWAQLPPWQVGVVPVELLKVRLQLQTAVRGQLGYVGPLSLLRRIWRTEGLPGTASSCRLSVCMLA